MGSTMILKYCLAITIALLIEYCSCATVCVDGSIAYPSLFGDGNSTLLNLKDVDGFSNGDMIILFDGTQFIETGEYDSTLLKSNKFGTLLWAKAFRRDRGILSTMLDMVVYNDTVIWIHGWMTSVKTSSYIGLFDTNGNNVYSYSIGSPYFFNNWISYGFVPLSSSSFVYTYGADPTENRQNISSSTTYDFAIAMGEFNTTITNQTIAYNVVIDFGNAKDYPWKLAKDSNNKVYLIGSSNANIVITTFSPTTLSSNIKSGTYPIASMYSFTSAANSTLSRDRFDIIISSNSTLNLGFGAFVNANNDPVVFQFDTTTMKIGNAVSVNTVYNGTAQHNYISVSLLMSGSNVIVLGTCYLCVLVLKFDVVIGQANSNYVEGAKTGVLAMFILNIGSTSTVVVSKMKVISTIPRVGRIDSGNYLIGGNGLSFEKLNSTKNQAIIFKSDVSLNFGSFSCYDMGTNITYNLLSLTPTYTAMSSSNGMNAVSKSSLPGFLNIGDPTASTFDIVNVTSFYPRPEGTYTTLDATNTTIYPCYSVAPTLVKAIPDKSYDISYSTPSETITPVFAQCQNVPLLYDLYIESSKSYPFWANFNSTTGSLLVRPAFAESSDMKDFNVTYVAIPNSGTPHETGFQTKIIMFNYLPSITVSYVTNTIYALQASTVDVQIEDPENNSIFYDLTYNNGLNIDSGLKYNIKFIGTNHWQATFIPANDQTNIGNFTINVSYWDQYHTDPSQKGNQNYTVVVLENFPPFSVTPVANQSVVECQSISFDLSYVDDVEKDYPIIYTNLTLPSTLDSSEISITVNSKPPNGTYQLGNVTISPKRSSIRSLYQTTMDVGVGVQDYVLLNSTVDFSLLVTKDKYPSINAPQNITLAVGSNYTINFAEIISDVETPFSQLTITCFVNGNKTLPSFMSCNSTYFTMSNLPKSAIDMYSILFNVKDVCSDGGVNSTSIKLVVLPDVPITVGNHIEDVYIYVNSGLKNITMPDHLFIDPENNYTVVMTMIPDNPKQPPLLKTLSNNKVIYVLIEAEPSYFGNFTITLTATDSGNNKAAASFKVYILDCVSTLCHKCDGPAVSDCVECIPGFCLKPNGGCTYNPQSSSFNVKMLFLLFLLIIIAISLLARKFELCSIYSVFMPILQMQYLYFLPLFISRPPVSFLEPLSYLSTSKFDLIIEEAKTQNTMIANMGTKQTFVNLKAVGYDSGMMMANMINLIIVVIVSVVFKFIFMCASRLKCCSKCTKLVILLKTLDSFIGVNFYFFVFLLSYMYVTLLCLSELFVFNIGGGPLSGPSIIFSLATLVLFGAATVGLIVYIKRRKCLIKRKRCERIREAYDVILNDFTRDTKCRLFYFFFILKRLLTVLICLMVGIGYLQLMLMVVLHFLFIVYIGYFTPFRKSRDLMLTFINEVITSIIIGGMIKFSDLNDESMPLGDEFKLEGTWMSYMIWTNLAIIVCVIVISDVCGYINYFKIKRLKKGKEYKEDAEVVQDLDKLNAPKYLKDNESFEESVEDDENMKFEMNKQILSQHSNKSMHKSIPKVDLPVVGFANLIDNYQPNELADNKSIINNQLPLMDIEKKQPDDFEWNKLENEIKDVLKPNQDINPTSNIANKAADLNNLPSLKLKKGLPPITKGPSFDDSLNNTAKPLADSVDNIYMGQQDAASPLKKKGPRDGVKLKKITKKKAKALKAAKQKKAKRNKFKLAQQLAGDGFNLDDGRNKEFRDWELMYGQKIADQIEFLYGSEYIDDAQIMKMLDADEIFQMLDEEDKLERIMAIRRKLELKKLKMIKLQQLKAQLNVIQGKGKGVSKKEVYDKKDIFDMVYEEKVEEEIKELEQSSEGSDFEGPDLMKNFMLNEQVVGEDSDEEDDNEGDEESNDDL